MLHSPNLKECIFSSRLMECTLFPCLGGVLFFPSLGGRGQGEGEGPPPFCAAYFFFGSTGYFSRSHSRQPPLRAYTFLKPLSINLRANLALVASFTQAQ